MELPIAGLRLLCPTSYRDARYFRRSALCNAERTYADEPTRPAQFEPPVSKSDTFTYDQTCNSKALAIGAETVARIFQQALLPASIEYCHDTLCMIEEYQQVFCMRDTELAALYAFLHMPTGVPTDGR